MRFLLEYDDFDIDNLLNDLSDLGVETLRGYVVIWSGDQDIPRMELIVSPTREEALAIYLHHGYFGPDFKRMILKKYPDAEKTPLTKYIKESDDIKDYDLNSWFGMLLSTNVVNRFTVVNNIAVNESRVKGPAYMMLEQNPDPYREISILDKFFKNAAQKFEEAKSKGSGPDEKLITIPLDDGYEPKNSSKNGWG